MKAEVAPNCPRVPDAGTIARIFCVDPVGIGVNVRSLAGPVRERWIAHVQAHFPGTVLRRVPLGIPDGRLLGGLDLAATLAAGRPVAEQGILAQSDGGVVVLAMAERIAAGTAARIAAVLDTGVVRVERDGLALMAPARVGVIALDEGIDADEALPATLGDRLALHCDLGSVSIGDSGQWEVDAVSVSAARQRLPAVVAGDDVIEGLCGAAVALGVESVRASVLAVRVARASAALAGREHVQEEDVVLAAQLVLAHRATRSPAEATPETDPADEAEQEGESASSEPRQQPPRDNPDAAGESRTPSAQAPLQDIAVAAAQAVMPAGLLAQFALQASGRARSEGRAGAFRQTVSRGRRAGTRRGEPGRGARLDVVETLRVAAPWQAVRRRERAGVPSRSPRVEVRRDDFRVARFRQRSATTTIFAVDASGSSALHRMAEAKGAVELLLAECYVRRDRVALIAFRDRSAELVLPPTRSLVRAKRSLAGLGGGGPTPLGTAIEAARELAGALRRRGDSTVIVFLTDGRANIALDGQADRDAAVRDALAAARRLREGGFTALLVDTAPRPQAGARTLAGEMAARYLPLPNADATGLNSAVRAASLSDAHGRAA